MKQTIRSLIAFAVLPQMANARSASNGGQIKLEAADTPSTDQISTSMLSHAANIKNMLTTSKTPIAAHPSSAALVQEVPDSNNAHVRVAKEYVLSTFRKNNDVAIQVRFDLF